MVLLDNLGGHIPQGELSFLDWKGLFFPSVDPLDSVFTKTCYMGKLTYPARDKVTKQQPADTGNMTADTKDQNQTTRTSQNTIKNKQSHFVSQLFKRWSYCENKF